MASGGMDTPDYYYYYYYYCYYYYCYYYYYYELILKFKGNISCLKLLKSYSK